MLRAIGRVWLWTVPLALAACDDGMYYDNRYGGGAYGYCDQYTSCGACTPVLGCGWCSYGKGLGICLSGPEWCGTQQFSWTWEPKGCTGDGGMTSPDGGDAGGDVSTPDGGTSTCTWPAAADTFVASDAGTSGCLPSTGGDLCSSSHYTLSCYGTSMPDAALGCTAVPVSGPANVAFSCCPCSP